MKVSTGFVAVDEADAVTEEEYKTEKAFEQKMRNNAETVYFTMCKNERKDNPGVYAFRDRVVGVIAGSYIMELLNQKDYYSYQEAKTDLDAKRHESICFNETRSWLEILDNYNDDKCINNMIYFDFILYLEEYQGIFYKNIHDNDYRAICSFKKNNSLPCLSTWSSYNFDTKKSGQKYLDTDDFQSGRYICAMGNYLPVIDRCIQRKWRRLFIAGNKNQRTHYNYISLYQSFLTEGTNESTWKSIYILESFTGFLLCENMYCYFLPYLKEVGMSDMFRKILKTYVGEIASIKHPFLRLYAFEMTKVSYSSSKELEIAFFKHKEQGKTDRDIIYDVIQKINQTYAIKWENAKRRIDYHLKDYWNDCLAEGSEKKEIHNVLCNAYCNLRKKIFYINGSPNESYSSYYNDKSTTMAKIYKDEWYTYISSMIYGAINTQE